MKMATFKVDLFEKSDNVVKWLEKFQSICKLNKWDDDQTKSTILGVSLHKIVYEELSETVAPQKITELSFAELEKALVNQYTQPKFVIAERYKLHQIVQTDTVQDYVTKLRKQIDSCEYGQFKNEVLRDKLIFGLRDKKVIEKLLTEKHEELTAEKVIQIASSYEQMATTPLLVGEKQQDVLLLNSKARPNVVRSGDVGRRQADVRCWCCGRKNHQKISCYYLNHKCKICNVIGHLENMCRQTNVNNVEQDDSDVFVILENKSGDFSRNVTINDVLINMLIDTGSSRTIINSTTAENCEN